VIDSHCHIAGPEFEGDLDAVAERGRAAGLTAAMVILAADDGPELARASAGTPAWPAGRI
jgi:Tat protein secretion system quality control protein TatD with DNase activity